MRLTLLQYFCYSIPSRPISVSSTISSISLTFSLSLCYNSIGEGSSLYSRPLVSFWSVGFSFPLPTSLSGSGVAPLSLQRSYGLATHRVFSFSIINLPPTSWLLTTKEWSGLYLLHYRFIPAERSATTSTQSNASNALDA